MLPSGKGVGAERRWVPPATFDGYRLLRPLGAGGMGLVYLGHDVLLDRQVAIKFIAGRDPDERRRERFLFEGRALARLIHPNVVLTFRVGDVEGQPFMVSEYVSGHSLDQIGRLPWRRVLDIGIGLARGLAAAHRAGILHRDVKPANVVLTPEGTVKLIDFGLAKFVGAGDAPVAPLDAELAPLPSSMAITDSDADAASDPGRSAADAGAHLATSLPEAAATTPSGSPELSRPGTIVGTRRYMAPELLARQPATRRSDAFSLGCVLHELCWGALPGEPVIPPDPPVAPEFQAILDKSLARDPADRFGSVEAVLENLEALAEDTSATGELPPGNPYRGLEAFDATHRAVFLGRSAEVLAVVEKLRSEAVVVVVGDSGAGKSSLCKAGVLPWIVESGLQTGRGAVALSLVPGREPLLCLAETLGSFLGEPAAALGDRMLEEPAEVVRALARTASERTIVIFVDQIEELFTLASADQAVLTARALAALARTGSQLRVLATVRGDFLARLAALPELGLEVARAPYLLRPLAPDKLREVIVGPARRSGVSFASPETVGELLRSALSSEGSLPLLQFTLAELWDMRDRNTNTIRADSLAGLGGLDGALERHADRVIYALSLPQRDVARRLLARLVTSQRTRAQLGHADLGELSDDDQATLEALIAGRLVVVRAGEGGAIYELAHEALIARWSTLRQWLEEDTAQLRLRERLGAAASEWQRLGRRGDGLWGRRQLASIAAIEPGVLAPAERAFLQASRAARRRVRLMQIAAPVAIALAIGLAIAGARLRGHAEITAAVARNLAEAHRHEAEARTHDAESERLRGDAFKLFDEGEGWLAGGARENSWQLAEDTWSRVLEVSATAASGYARANSAFEAALFIDPSRGDVRDDLAHLLAARLALAERLHQRELMSEIAERLSGLLAAGADPSLRTAEHATLSVRRVPPGASMSIARVEPDSAGRLTLGPASPLSDAPETLAPGSYVVTGTAPGRAAVRLPVLLARGQRQSIELALPPASAVPPGFIFVPAGETLVGADEENLRVALWVGPMHPLWVNSFLIGRFEVTFGDYIAWLDTLPLDEQSRRTPRNLARPGVIELRPGPDHHWMLVLEPVEKRYTATWGQPIRYEGRTQRRFQDWRRFPVSGISYEDAEGFARWLDRIGRVPGARMCREEEWERAGRGADGRIYTTGRQLAPSDANFDLTYGAKDIAFGPDEVGSHPESASVFGVDDLEGNADEMVKSGRWGDTTALRGGSWFRERVQQRIDNRFRNTPTTRNVEMGFRLCADATIK